MSRQFGIGLVGAGRFGAFCVDALQDLPDARVVAVMDTNRSRALEVAPPGAAIHDHFDALLDDPAIDIVHIATPPFLHGPLARQAVERGKHVFVEKPLATSLADARAAIVSATSAGVQLSIDYVLRHHPLYRLAIAISRSGALGNLQHFALENFASSEGLPPDHWFWDPTLSGGIHVEHGVHFFDLCMALVGQVPDSVSGNAQRRADGRADRVSALLGFGDRTAATFYHSFNGTDARERTSVWLAFEHGRATVEGWIPTRLDLEGTIPQSARHILDRLLGAALRTDGRPSAASGGRVSIAATVERPDRQSEYALAIRAGMTDLLATIRYGRLPTVTPLDGLRSLEIALRASDA